MTARERWERRMAEGREREFRRLAEEARAPLVIFEPIDAAGYPIFWGGDAPLTVLPDSGWVA